MVVDITHINKSSSRSSIILEHVKVSLDPKVWKPLLKPAFKTYSPSDEQSKELA
jgi:hypothetical protein